MQRHSRRCKVRIHYEKIRLREQDIQVICHPFPKDQLAVKHTRQVFDLVHQVILDRTVQLRDALCTIGICADETFGLVGTVKIASSVSVAEA